DGLLTRHDMVASQLQLAMTNTLRPRLRELRIVQIRPEHLDPIALQRDIILTGILHLVLDIAGTQLLLEVSNPPRVVHGSLLSLLPRFPSTSSRSPGQISPLP